MPDTATSSNRLAGRPLRNRWRIPYTPISSAMDLIYGQLKPIEDYNVQLIKKLER